MPQIIGSYQVSAFITPANETTGDADVVRGNDNTVRAALNNHDSDVGIHLQGSTLAARPVAGSAGRKWMTTDDRRIFYDDGSTWNEISYASSASPTFTGTVTIPGTVTSASNTTMNVGGLGAYQFGGGSIQLDQGGFKTNAVSLLLNCTNAGGSIILQTNGTQRWQVNSSGHILAISDGVYDIGAAGANRVRTIYQGGSTVVVNANGLKVIGLRQQSYTAWTGTVNRVTAFDQSTVTLAQLAQRVAALQTDLETHGLIGP